MCNSNPSGVLDIVGVSLRDRTPKVPENVQRMVASKNLVTSDGPAFKTSMSMRASSDKMALEHFSILS